MDDKRLRMDNTLLQVRANWTTPTGVANNVMYFKKKDITGHIEDADFSAWDDALATKASDYILGALANGFLSELHANVTLAGADWVWNESAPDGPLHAGTNATYNATSGGQTGDALPAMVALCVHLGTGLAGRDNAGRFYLPGMNTGLVDTPDFDHLKPGSVADFALILGTLHSDLVGNGEEDLVGDGYNVYAQVASFFVPGSFAGNQTGTLRDVAVSHTVAAYSLKTTAFATMNSRKVGHGI